MRGRGDVCRGEWCADGEWPARGSEKSRRSAARRSAEKTKSTKRRPPFRSKRLEAASVSCGRRIRKAIQAEAIRHPTRERRCRRGSVFQRKRSEEHTSE